MSYKCPKCREKDVWSITSRTADLGSYGSYSWIRCQCQRCGHIWVERIRLDVKEEDPKKSRKKSKNK